MALVGQVAEVVARQARTGAAEDRIDADRLALCQLVQTEHRRIVTDDVVLAEVAEDRVAAAVTFYIVIAIATDAGPVFHGFAASHDINRDLAQVVDGRTITLDPVITALTEDHIVIGTAGDDVAAVGIGG